MTNDGSTRPRTLKTVATASEVIDGLVELDGAGVTELADYIGISKSTAYTYLKTLEQQELVISEDQTYRLSYAFLLLGEYVRNGSLLYQAGRQPVDDLAEALGGYAHLVVEENGRGITIHEARGEETVAYEYQTTKPERRDPLHVTASGKAILASLPDRRVEEIVDRHGLEAWTERTITGREALFEELKTVRERGFARNDEEEVAGFRAVAAPVRTGNGAVLGSVSVSGPTNVLDDEAFSTELPERVSDTANSIEVSINMMRKQSDIR